ncbi:semaphorin-5A isoform X4 [Ixodes scapularis]|uniref:semaphorin-5A isoform X4 n=1 Tax=Ixodes scapularis TaxID=6945 RepID=UPI001C387026|nr:semaphorin-5A isoform X4 [Ixodes scapularis]
MAATSSLPRLRFPLVRHAPQLALLWWALLCTAGPATSAYVTVSEKDLDGKMERFSHGDTAHFTKLLFDINRYQLIVGARDHLFRLSLEGFKKLEEVNVQAPNTAVKICRLKGRSEEDCRNYFKVLLSHNGQLFSCGTNAFAPKCTWRDINSLVNVIQQVDGVGYAPYSPHSNSSELMTVQGDYYVAAPLDFSARDYALYRGMGKGRSLRTPTFDHKWLSEPSFVGSFEIGEFVYVFYRESAVEFMNCGKAVYSRVARVCKNDQGGRLSLKDNWTTFLKARLNCSLPGLFPFYYNEIQSVHYLEDEELFYATFTTGENSIYGSAICAFNMSAIRRAFDGPLKFQANSKAAWERSLTSGKQFQCDKPRDDTQVLEARNYQLTDDAVQAASPRPFYTGELERLTHITVDVVPTKYNHDGVHVIFAATLEGTIKKLMVVPRVLETCLIEELTPFPPRTRHIYTMKLLKDTSSLYLGTDKEVLRIILHRCEQYRTEESCLGSMDPYCGWNKHQLSCTTAPQRNPLSTVWKQDQTACPESNVPVDGGWSGWNSWQECDQVGKDPMGDRCLCRSRACDSPAPLNGGKPCEGSSLEVTNCTQNGQWTEWSAWSACSQSCGIAVKSRRRTCSNPKPKHGGRVCLGPEQEQIYCSSNPPCPVPTTPAVTRQSSWSEWGAWSECSAQCGGGFQWRRRQCHSPKGRDGCGGGCESDYRACNTHACSEKRRSSNWTSWMRVNATREGHFEQRFRFTCRANVADDNLLHMGSIKKEERYCHETSKSCMDAAYLSNIDGDWSEWGEWSQCSVPCGGGVQLRERLCDSPRPSGKGAECQGPSREQRDCNIHECHSPPTAEDEEWTEWSVWSLCDHNNEQHRRRTCTVLDPSPEQCRGSTRESRMCIAGQDSIASVPRMQETREISTGIRVEHLVGACIACLALGALVGALGTYRYAKRRGGRGAGGIPKHLGTPLVQAEGNTYVPPSQFKNNFSTLTSTTSPSKLQREATIKRNGFRAQLQLDQNF